MPYAFTETQTIKETLNLAMVAFYMSNRVSYEYSIFIKPDLRPAVTIPGYPIVWNSK